MTNVWTNKRLAWKNSGSYGGFTPYLILMSVIAVLAPGCADRKSSSSDDETKSLQWTKAATVGEPAALFHAEHAAVFEALGNRIIMMWGRSSLTFQAGVWELQIGDTEKVIWEKLSPLGKELPSRRGGHVAVYDSQAKRIILFGGYDSETQYDEVWELNFHTNAIHGIWQKLEPSVTSMPPKLRGHAAIFDDTNNRMITFGGWFGDLVNFPTNDLYALNFTDLSDGAWNKLVPGTSEGLPDRRAEHSAIVDSENNRMVIFGGLGQEGDLVGDDIYLNDTWELTLSQDGAVAWNKLEVEGEPPAPRSGHAALYDAVDQRMIVFGGSDGGQSFNDLWIMDLSQAGKAVWTEWISADTEPPLPSVRQQHIAVNPASDEDLRMILYGGNNDNTGEVWMWGLK